MKLFMTAHSVKTIFQPTLAIQDSRFNVYLLKQCHLVMSLGITSLKIACIDRITHRCLLIEAYTIKPNALPERISAMEQLWQAHPLLASQSWNTITLGIENQQYTLVPKPLFQEENTAVYLNLAATSSSQVVQYCIHPTLNLVVAFAVEPLLLAWFQTRYAQSNFLAIHQASSLIAGISSYSTAKRLGAIPRVFVIANETHVHITVMGEKKLYYYNRFTYYN